MSDGFRSHATQFTITIAPPEAVAPIPIWFDPIADQQIMENSGTPVVSIDAIFGFRQLENCGGVRP